MIKFTPEQQLRCLANNVQPLLVALVDGYSYDPGDSDLRQRATRNTHRGQTAAIAWATSAPHLF